MVTTVIAKFEGISLVDSADMLSIVLCVIFYFPKLEI